jgi:RNA polymerase sigma factor
LTGRWFRSPKKPPQTSHEASPQGSALGACVQDLVHQDPVKEIAHFKSRLKEFGIDLNHLAACSPKEMKRRADAIHVAQKIAEDPDMRNYFLTWKRLPLLHDHKPQLQKITMKRQRVYITALTLIFIEKYEVLMNYLPGTGGEHL